LYIPPDLNRQIDADPKIAFSAQPPAGIYRDGMAQIYFTIKPEDIGANEIQHRRCHLSYAITAGSTNQATATIQQNHQANAHACTLYGDSAFCVA